MIFQIRHAHVLFSALCGNGQQVAQQVKQPSKLLVCKRCLPGHISSGIRPKPGSTRACTLLPGE